MLYLLKLIFNNVPYQTDKVELATESGMEIIVTFPPEY